MSVESTADGGFVVTGEHIGLFRLIALEKRLKMEMIGMKGHGSSAYTIIKKEFNLKGNRGRVHEQFREIIEDKKKELADA
jgi:hypothetical protein